MNPYNYILQTCFVCVCVCVCVYLTVYVIYLFHSAIGSTTSSNLTCIFSLSAPFLQAIRIEVNGEFRVLEKLLEALPRLLKPGGRVVFLTFHSGVCRTNPHSFSLFSSIIPSLSLSSPLSSSLFPYRLRLS